MNHVICRQISELDYESNENKGKLHNERNTFERKRGSYCKLRRSLVKHINA